MCTNINKTITGKNIIINDISRLESINIKNIIRVEDEESLKKLIIECSKRNNKITTLGTQHSQGGQSIYDDAIVLDMKYYNRILNLNIDDKLITVQSGITWEKIQNYINPHNLSIKSMQSSNSFTVGGSLSANIHGRDINNSLIIDTVESFRLLVSSGKVIKVSRDENFELFRLVIGGYGLFGVIMDVTISLCENSILKKKIDIINYKSFPEFFNVNVLNNSNAALFMAWPSIAPSSYLSEIVVTTWEKSNNRILDDRLLNLGKEKHVLRDKTIYSWSRKSNVGKEFRWALQKYFYARKGSQLFLSRNNAMRPPTTPQKFLDYKSDKYTDILQEYFIPIHNFQKFLEGMYDLSKICKMNLLAITIRYVGKNEESFLSYSQNKQFSIMISSNIPISKEGKEKSIRTTRKLVDLAIQCSGLYYLTYQRFPSKSQMKRAYPMIDKFFEMKRYYDKDELFMNKFYKHYK